MGAHNVPVNLTGIPLNAIRKYFGLGEHVMESNRLDRLKEILYTRGVDVQIEQSSTDTHVNCTTRHVVTSLEDIEEIEKRYDAYNKALDNVEDRNDSVIPVTYAMKATKNVEYDMVNHPKHYQSKSGLEVIDVIEAFTDGLNGIEASDTANIIKYACRWKDKNGAEDLRKIAWYANHLANYLEKK